MFWTVFGMSLWDLGGAWCFGIYLGFWCGTWEVLCVLRDLRVEVLGGLRNRLKA